MAGARIARETPGQTLQPTDLVHEAYLRLVGNQDPGWDGRRHFFAAASEVMRRLLVDQARRKKVRREHAERSPPQVDELLIEPPDDHVLDVDEALRRLEAADPRKGRLVTLRYFCGLSNEETAAALGVSVGTVEREWRFIRAILLRELGRREPSEPA